MWTFVINQLNEKRASLFGIDARITILIVSLFGLVTTPIMYSVVSNAKADAIVASMRNVDQAIEDYISDTGSIPSSIDNLYDTLPAKGTQSSVWAGPYLTGEKTSDLVPSLTWTLESTDAVKYLSYTLVMTFSNISSAVAARVGERYSDDSLVVYDSDTETLAVSYGQSKAGTYKRIKYKVTEAP